MIIDEAMAGSMPTRFRNKGIEEPVTPAIKRFPVIARKQLVRVKVEHHKKLQREIL